MSTQGANMFYKILVTINILASAVVVYYFVVGLLDGSVSDYNIRLWLSLLLGIACVLGGSYWLRQRGFRRAALALSLVLAIPAFLYGCFILLVLLTNPRWN